MKTITLSDDRRAALVGAIQTLYRRELDDEISAFRAETLLDLMIAALGPAVYNQAVQDVRAHLQGKLDDLDGEVYVDEA